MKSPHRLWLLASTFIASAWLPVAAEAALKEVSSHQARIYRAPMGEDLREGVLAHAGASDPQDIIADFLAQQGRSEATLDSLEVYRENFVERTGITHFWMVQRVDGFLIQNTYLKAAINMDGQLVSVVDMLQEIPEQVDRQRSAQAFQKISPELALQRVLEKLYPAEAKQRLQTPLRRLPATSDQEAHLIRFEKGTRFYSAPEVTKVWLPLEAGGLEAGYRVQTWDHGNQLHHSLVGALGTVLDVQHRTNTDSYAVFLLDPEKGGQVVVEGPGEGNDESPIGWVSSNTTIGNNVDAYLDAVNDNAADPGGRPTSDTQEFLTTVELSQEPSVPLNQMAAVHNLFFLTNHLHDILYRHGFTEAAGNFQQDNFGLGGLGNDPLNAEAQDGGGTNNANFSSPDDGQRPRMQMYLWTMTSPRRDGSLDSDIVYHEYGHGLTWRMIGNMSGGLAGAIGEGMSDGVAILVNEQDTVAEYSYANPNGIRRNPYTNYPRTYADVTGRSVHNDGEIYGASVWKLWELWRDNGLDKSLLMDYVIDGMNYTPSQPSYEAMRDGILQSIPDTMRAQECLVWQAYATYGIGVGARGYYKGFGLRRKLVIEESFTVPTDCR